MKIKLWPATQQDIEAAGYQFAGMTQCSGSTCTDIIQWVKTPNGKRLPLTVMPDLETYRPHFADCPDVKRFR